MYFIRIISDTVLFIGKGREGGVDGKMWKEGGTGLAFSTVLSPTNLLFVGGIPGPHVKQGHNLNS